ncbi:hypothetical protein EDB92DRAFT_2080754 [Lactarius akahatsu]|uniref:Uncharacterized protein n=1 Tax=Lactarius akahatsu TaxID=416441 RepID=A0AAD4QHF3_9AGAM|nr:hypothetical protein EDB92DRAFT_2080754 [Lactarius akahatsu]
MGDHRQQLARLSIPPPFPVPFYSPAIQTAIHQRFPPAFPPPSVLQTPIQPSFFPAPSPGPHRPIHPGHRAAQASIALAAAGIHPPHGPPLTPLGHAQFPQTPFAGPQFPQFRNRRQPSVSIGGPPKAQLGGAGKNYRPPSPTANVVPVAQKSNKATVNLPKETVPAGDGRPPTRSSFARTPIPPHLVPPQPPVPPPDVISADIHPPDNLRVEVPDTVEVFLPGKPAWDDVKKRFIDEKLEKLGIEKGNGSSMPHIHAPHARAASISSPADPALLFFKLNKLQQAQNSHSHSASVSPQPHLQMFNNSLPPPAIIQPLPSVTASSAPLRHGHSLSMAAAPFIPMRPYATFNNSAAFNLFGPGTSLAPDAIRSPDARSDPGLPTDQSLAPPAMPARADSRPDFIRGFGLDVPEEAEEEQEETEPDEQVVTEVHEEEPMLAEVSHIAVTGADDTIDMEFEEADAEVGDITTAAQSRIHSRHVSRLSAALSLRSVGGHMEYPEPEVQLDGQGETESDPEDDAIGEWTGSEDLRTPTEFTEDEESIGEWSNPSDEERARQQRQQRRVMRRAHHQQQQDSIQIPRRIPNFPHPPPNPAPLSSLLSQPRRESDEDMISNPSDDNFDRPRALPLPPSSRPPSSRLSMHDSIRAHSRAPSSNLVPTPYQIPISLPIQAPIPKRTEMLNPHAKPFVFGGPGRLSGSFSPGTFGPQPQQQQQQAPVSHVSQPPLAFGHSRGPSLGKPLNAGAPEFRPNVFTFTLPPDVPKFPQPQPPSTPPPRSSPPPHAIEDAGPIRAQQGREKRQRCSSVGSVAASDVSGDGRVVMTSFKFPQESPARKSAPPSPAQRQGALNAAARPFTLPGLGGIDIGAIKEAALRAESPVSGDGDADEDGDGDIEGNDVDDEHELPMPLSMKARRAPIPLDFKHPVSTNTVPAGLFKALANGNGSSNGHSNSASIAGEAEEPRTRRTVQSRLSSREIFEHASRPSLDDLHVPAISHKASRGRLVTDPGRWDVPIPQQEPPPPVRDRRASLPMMSSARSSFSDTSDNPQDISRRLELQQYEERLEALLESKLDDFREEVRALRLEAGANGAAGSTSTEAAINGVVSLFRAQLQVSAARGLDDSQMDARGELDFQLVRDIVEQGHAEARAVIQQDLDRILRRVEALQSAEVTPINGGGTEAMLEEYHARTRNTVVDAITPISERLDALERIRTRTPLPPPPPQATTTMDHEALVRDLRAGLVPHIAATRAEPIDYDVLTEQLSQAVKPHISQLIDLASDKRETAGLIVDRLVPMLPQIFPPAGSNFDVPAVVAQVAAEIRRIVAPLDPHEMKEQVSGLVVERLDSRLATRDRVLDGLQSKLVDGFDHVLEPVNEVVSRVAELSKGQEALSLQTRDLAAAASHNASDLLSTIPELLAGATEPLRTMLADHISTGPGLPSPEDFLRIGSTVENLSTGQQALQDKASELLALHQDVLSRLMALPDSMAASIKAAQLAHAELLSHTVTKADFEEVRNMMATNSDLQVQLAKARAQHGAARAENDIMLERISSAEADRNQLRIKVDEIQALMLLRATDAATSQARTTELEEALSQSLARLKTSDVTIESQQERLLELEKLNRELNADKQALVSEVHTLEVQAGFASRDKDAAVEALAMLRKENDALVLQQSHWEDLRRANEQLEQLAALVSKAQAQTTSEPAELKELRRATKVLESEHAALQRRYKEQETRLANSERAASTARAGLAQAQQRADEWEQRANEYEVEIEDAHVGREQAEDRAAQLEAEHGLVRMQLAEKDAEERLAKDRESTLREQVAVLEARVAQLQARSRKTPVGTTSVSSPPRPDSRTSTVYPSRAATPTAASANGRRADTPPQTSVYDSIHAPLNRKAVAATPRRSVFAAAASRYDWSPAAAANAARRVASPAPSVVSVAPTLGDDGWYE